MRTLAVVAVLCASPVAALACSPIAVTAPAVSRGEGCRVSYTDIKAPQFVSSYEVVKLGGGIVRQQIHSGICDSGERIVAYFDCATGTGAWLGGPIDAPGLPQPAADAKGYVAPIIGQGVDGAFIDFEERRLTEVTPEAILARARDLDWVPQSGAIQSPRMVVDGKRFDLNCGCKLFYPLGVN